MPEAGRSSRRSTPSRSASSPIRAGRSSGRAERAAASFAQLCAPPPSGSLADPFPPFAATDPDTVVDAARAQGEALARDVFGADLDPAAIIETSADPSAAQCQRRAWRAVASCEHERLVAFRSCARDALRGKPVPPTVTSAAELRDRCLGVNSEDQPDPHDRIAQRCSLGGMSIGAEVAEHCATQDLATLFPGCASADPVATTACLTRAAACRACRAVNGAAGLDRNCDRFDNGLDDGSCGSCPCFTSAAIDALFPPGYFDQNGLGGATCHTAGSTGLPFIGITSSAQCQVGPIFRLPRAVAAVMPFQTGPACMFYGVDAPCFPPNGFEPPPLSDEQVAACEAEPHASQLWQRECVPPPATPTPFPPPSPTPACPCWTEQDLEDAFPAGFFDDAGRGGASCLEIATQTSLTTSASCGGFPRAGAAVFQGLCATRLSDVDPDQDGRCDDGATVTRPTTSAEQDSCVQSLLRSSVWQRECR